MASRSPGDVRCELLVRASRTCRIRPGHRAAPGRRRPEPRPSAALLNPSMTARSVLRIPVRTGRDHGRAPMHHRRLHRAQAAAAAALGLLVAPASASGAPAADRLTAHSGPSARVWVTTPDRAQLMQADGKISFVASPSGTTPSDPTTIVVDPGRTYQRMEGFGAAITDSSAAVLYRL